jgi:hypothetical protein
MEVICGCRIQCPLSVIDYVYFLFQASSSASSDLQYRPRSQFQQRPSVTAADLIPKLHMIRSNISLTLGMPAQYATLSAIRFLYSWRIVSRIALNLSSTMYLVNNRCARKGSAILHTPPLACSMALPLQTPKVSYDPTLGSRGSSLVEDLTNE